jgi:hypothetical protein
MCLLNQASSPAGSSLTTSSSSSPPAATIFFVVLRFFAGASASLSPSATAFLPRFLEAPVPLPLPLGLGAAAVVVAVVSAYIRRQTLTEMKPFVRNNNKKQAGSQPATQKTNAKKKQKCTYHHQRHPRRPAEPDWLTSS